VSKVGGSPDLPPSLAWPTRNGYRAGFFLQLALAELPRTKWNPWPTHGMVYLFCHDDQATYSDPPSWELLYWDGRRETLTRGVEPNEPLLAGSFFFQSSDPRRLLFRVGTDFPPGSQNDWHDFVHPLEDAGRSRGDEQVLERYFEFVRLAADPEVEQDLAKGRGPYFYPVGQLFGRTDRSIRADLTFIERGDASLGDDWEYRRKHAAEIDRQGAAWKQIMKLYSNPATDYLSACDAAPVYVMAKDPGTRPWLPNGLVYGLASK
jgi:uncharacterized protein DUF1963